MRTPLLPLFLRPRFSSSAFSSSTFNWESLLPPIVISRSAMLDLTRVKVHPGTALPNVKNIFWLVSLCWPIKKINRKSQQQIPEEFAGFSKWLTVDGQMCSRANWGSCTKHDWRNRWLHASGASIRWRSHQAWFGKQNEGLASETTFLHIFLLTVRYTGTKDLFSRRTAYSRASWSVMSSYW